MAELLERDAELTLLGDAVARAARGDGSAVLVFGEAGIGKTSVIRAATEQARAAGARVLSGACDDLATPRTLGPLRDASAGSAGPLHAAITSRSDRDELYEAALAELSAAPGPVVLVVEDAHWADDATLDVLSFLARRIAGLPAVLVLSYRDDEVDRDHPLQRVLGRLSGPVVRRVPVHHLSREAVRRLAAGTTLDPAELYTVTGGNPFFVTEVVAAGADGVPHTVADAVLSRVRRLDPVTAEVLEQLAVLPGAAARGFVQRLIPGGIDALAPAEERGLLVVSPAHVSFRHEVARRTVAASLPGSRRLMLTRRALSELLEADEIDLSLVMHLAAAADDGDAIATYGPVAARDAARAGSHRQAAAHYRATLVHADAFDAQDRAELLEEYAVECYYTAQGPAAVAAQEQAVELRRELEDPVRLGADLRWLSRMHSWTGSRAPAEAAAREAIEVLEGAGDAGTLACAYSNWAQLAMVAYRDEEAVATARRAEALARSVGNDEVLTHALTNLGGSLLRLGRRTEGTAALEEALRVSLTAGLAEHACRTYVALGWHALDEHAYDDARRRVAAGMELAQGAEQLAFLGYLQMMLGRAELETGNWDLALKHADRVLHADQLPTITGPALYVAGRVRVRRGEAAGDTMLERAWQLAVRADELQRLAPVVVARAESAWLQDEPAGVLDDLRQVYALACDIGYGRLTAEVAHALWRLGEPVTLGADVVDPYADQVAGRWQEAASTWDRLGCPYEAAIARLESDDPEATLEALQAFDLLRAEPAARRARVRLRELGITRVPRGPTTATRDNPENLTERQLEVLQLLALGLTNSEIADRLVVSVRTVDHHVAAVLDKLQVGSRRDAARRAGELGLTVPAVPGVPAVPEPREPLVEARVH